MVQKKKSVTEKKIDAAVRLLERHGYSITPPAEPVVIDTIEVNKRKLELRRLDFIEQMKKYQHMYPSTLLNDFYAYWTEPNKTYTKMRFELQKTFELSLRLSNWFRRNNKRSNGRQQTTDEERLNKLADIVTGKC